MTGPRPRVFFITSNPPMDEMGGCVLFHRQFVERDDYELFVVTDRHNFSSDRFPFIIHEHPALIRRLLRTRLSLFVHDYIHVCAGAIVPRRILKAARDFKPDFILTGAETWLADTAYKVARKLDVPFAGHFMDWPTFAMAGHAWAKRHASEMFRRRYQRCDLAFGICPEMLEALGAHRNAQVFYPSGQAAAAKGPKARRTSAEPYALLFAGNLGQWYGKMLERLAPCFEAAAGVQLRIAGGSESWDASVKAKLTRDGVYLGFLKGADYQRAFERADALLLIMGFGEGDRLIESTSFKSKLADYLASGLPVIVWGPEYCTAVRHARRENFAEVVTENDPAAVIAALRMLAGDPERAARLVENGRRFWEMNLNAELVMRHALEAANSLVAGARTRNFRKSPAEELCVEPAPKTLDH